MGPLTRTGVPRRLRRGAHEAGGGSWPYTLRDIIVGPMVMGPGCRSRHGRRPGIATSPAPATVSVTTRDPDSLLPLSPPVLHILLALGHERLHGYAMMRAIEEKTDGVATVLPGSLYTTLGRMLDQDLVEEAPPPEDDPEDDRRRRYYRMTDFGREVVAAESRRMAVLLDLARRQRMAGGG